MPGTSFTTWSKLICLLQKYSNITVESSCNLDFESPDPSGGLSGLDHLLGLVRVPLRVRDGHGDHEEVQDDRVGVREEEHLGGARYSITINSLELEF